MEGAAEEEEELKTKRIPKHSEACGNAYMVACLTFYNRKVCFFWAMQTADANFKPRCPDFSLNKWGFSQGAGDD